MSATIRSSPTRPTRPESRVIAFKPSAAPLDGEPVVGKQRQQRLHRHGARRPLDGLGATTLVICGVLTHNSVEATARHAGDLGYRVFVVADACWAVDKIDLRGRRWLADDVHALSLAHLQASMRAWSTPRRRCCAASVAKARQRRAAGKT